MYCARHEVERIFMGDLGGDWWEKAAQLLG